MLIKETMARSIQSIHMDVTTTSCTRSQKHWKSKVHTNILPQTPVATQALTSHQNSLFTSQATVTTVDTASQTARLNVARPSTSSYFQNPQWSQLGKTSWLNRRQQQLQRCRLQIDEVFEANSLQVK